MINSGNTRKYLLYAIGEIALVVIGILIALQINNSNEFNKERVYEKKMLEQIRTQLRTDTAYFHMLIRRMTRIDTSAQRIIAIQESGSNDRDNFIRYTRHIGHGFHFEFNNGAYEALKSSGIEKVQNDQLRNALINLYDFTLPRTRHMLWLSRTPEMNRYKRELRSKAFDYRIVEDEEDGSKYYWRGEYKLEDLDDPLFIEYLAFVHGYAQDGLSRTKTELDRVLDVLVMLDEELIHRHGRK